MLQDKTILLCGAAQGIGQATAVEFAKLGAKLILADVNACTETGTLVQAQGGESVAVQVDITNFQQCQAAIAVGVENFGCIDGLINLAAMYATLTMAPMEFIPDDEFEACMRVNVKGTWNMCRAVAPVMKEAGGGSIVNMASNSALLGFPNATQYTASKGAVIMMSRSMAAELGEFNIRVNTVAPTVVATDSSKQLMGDHYDELMGMAANMMQKIKRNPQGSDIAGTLTFLMSDASEFITGQSLIVDGGAYPN